MLETPQFKLALPHKGNVFEANHVRVTFITPRFVRFEWAADGKFEDRETMAVLNRDLGKVSFESQLNGNKATLKTSQVTVKLVLDGKPLSDANLELEFNLNGKPVKWTPSAPQTGNLKGSCRTLDLCNGDRVVKYEGHGTDKEESHELKLGNGFISRDGWSLIDDSKNVVVDLDGDRKWVAPRTDVERQDWYVLAYGHDYLRALKDAADVFGSQPLPPRYTLGYWFSRYWAYSDEELCDIATEFDRAGVPLDVLVVDMDWHLEGWTGYTWDWRYFPDPAEFLAEMKRRNLKITLNLHPADGVAKHEEQFEKMAKAMKLDPKKIDRVPFDITSKEYMKHYFKILHHPDEKRGVDFWWMDWQQGESSAMKGLDTLPWINHLHWEDMQLHGKHKRPLIFSRFGGVGAGRYVIGFSGDTYSTWKSLAYQPYFTATASNVLYGYWSHDIGGHMEGAIDPELYLRWVQYGMLSPILRTHTTKNANAERRFMEFPAPYSHLMMDTVRQRYELVPYIYSENRKAYDSGVSLCRPLYYNWPEDSKTYELTNEYMFGDEMLVSPVSAPGDKNSELTNFAVYLPQGKWFDVAHGNFVEGGQTVTKHWMLSEIPVFVRPGTIIPGQKMRMRLDEKSYSHLTMDIYPGEAGCYELYEDDGISDGYLHGKYAIIDLSHHKKGFTRVIDIVHQSGKFDGFLRKRELEVRLHCVVPPKKVEINGKKAELCFRLDGESSRQYRYDGLTASIIIACGEIDLVKGAQITVEYDRDNESEPVLGLAGVFRRLQRVAILHNEIGGCLVVDVEERLGQELAHAAYRISREPKKLNQELENLQLKLPRLPGEIKKQSELVTWGDVKRRKHAATVAVNLLKHLED